MKWLDTSSINQTQINSAEFWENLQTDINEGSFWADRIKKLHNEPIQRLQLALQNLPLPAGFREAAIAIRTLVRLKLSKNFEFTDEIALLYWLAAVESFGIPYSEFLRQPGFNVLESVPGNVIKSLPFSYQKLGYKHLGLLNKTDIKWCIACWGEPNQHTTLNALHSELWQKYERELPEKQRLRITNLPSSWSPIHPLIKQLE
jgi:hypothetical protein